MTYLSPSVHQPTVVALRQKFEDGELTGPEFHEAVKRARIDPTYRYKPKRLSHVTGNVFGVQVILAHHGGWMTVKQIKERITNASSAAVPKSLRSLYYSEEVERRGKGTTYEPYEYRLKDG